MNLFDATKTAVKGLQVNWGRSLLTILGIIIGVMSIVTVVALGQGAQALILKEVQSIGANTLVLRPGRQPEGPTDIAQTIMGDSIKERDIEALKKTSNAPGIKSVVPGIIVPGSVSYRDSVYRPMIIGWSAEGFAEIYSIQPEEGSLFTEQDIEQRRKVAILGDKVKKELFGGSDAVGRLVKIKRQNFRVVGVFSSLGQVSSFNMDEIVLIPYSTAQKELLNIDYYHEVLVKAKDDADIDQVAEDVRETIRATHHISENEKDDFFVMTQEDIVERIKTVTRTLTIFLVMIASISLLVGGIGIMNIMLVSVTERTREIGLRKAVGANNKDILQQFLIEAVILTASGGALGTVLAVAISALASYTLKTQFGLDWPFRLPTGAIIIGIGTAVVVGIIFGIYPARKAAKQDPIEALRYE